MNIYQVFIRNHTKQGTIHGLIQDLPRIKAMDFSYLYLMPFHPISKAGRKGTFGSPYAIADYKTVDADYGSIEDLRQLIKAAHALGLKVIMDIVFNHTGNDHVYIHEHPNFYILNENGEPTRKVAEWSDITDFDFSQPDLRAELISVLMFWAEKHIDGFRCDVASLINLEFWKEAKQQVNEQFPNLKWFAETIDPLFLRALKKQGHAIASDYEILQVFDGCYNYDLWPTMQQVMKKEVSLTVLSHLLNYQTAMLPIGKSKWYFLDNHDQPRINGYVSRSSFQKWLAFVLLMPGNGFVYAGSESYQTKDTPLFEQEVISRDFDPELVAYITRLNQLKNQMYAETVIDVITFAEGECLRIEVETLKQNYVFFINFGDEVLKINASGINLLTNQVVENGTIDLSEGVFFSSVR